MFTAKIDTSVTRLSSRSIVNAPRIARPPTASGRLAAVRPPKTTTSRTSTIGIDSDSARPMSALTWVVMSLPMASLPPSRTSRPGGASRRVGSRSWYAAMTASSSSPTRCRTA